MAQRFWRTGLTEMSFAARRRAFVTACAAYVPALTGRRRRGRPGGHPGPSRGPRRQAPRRLRLRRERQHAPRPKRPIPSRNLVPGHRPRDRRSPRGALAATLHVPALLAQLVEHFHGKEGVSGSSPEEGSSESPCMQGLFRCADRFERWRADARGPRLGRIPKVSGGRTARTRYRPGGKRYLARRS